jgi:hypothetical protein
MKLCGVQSYGSDLLVVHQDTGSLISGSAVVGGREHRQQVPMLLDLETSGLALVSSDHVGEVVAGQEVLQCCSTMGD